MFRIERTGKNRVDIEMSGKLDDESMQKALDEIVAKTADIENGQMLYDVIDYHLPTVSAIRIEFSRLPSMLGLMKKFNRVAVLTDKRWLKTISELEGLFFPHLEIKGFRREERDDAQAWLSEGIEE
jgi:hypothetical protein